MSHAHGYIHIVTLLILLHMDINFDPVLNSVSTYIMHEKLTSGI